MKKIVKFFKEKVSVFSNYGNNIVERGKGTVECIGDDLWPVSSRKTMFLLLSVISEKRDMSNLIQAAVTNCEMVSQTLGRICIFPYL
ncbi:hypothetical protein CEXT_158401 [Caerostris extrusa]|uniref:Uncharacterized protein n=1 Tax=Caerostris extrusa TaxID=172846 RepID=A0AAV4Y8I5_CAEEX|nr:hypothetical protein CEXT_158401 [Caerostris extrusa]